MQTPAEILKALPYLPKGEKQEFPPPSKAKPLLLNFLPSKCQQNEQGFQAFSDYNLQKNLVSLLWLSGNTKQVPEKGQLEDEGDSTFEHVFGSNCKFNRLIQYTIY